jgi:hypothetical protein
MRSFLTNSGIGSGIGQQPMGSSPALEARQVAILPENNRGQGRTNAGNGLDGVLHRGEELGDLGFERADLLLEEA